MYNLYAIITGGMLMNGTVLDTIPYHYTILSTFLLFIAGGIIGYLIK